MTKKLEDAIGADAAAAVEGSPTLGFTYLVTLRDFDKPETFATLDGVFQAHGGALIFGNYVDQSQRLILPAAAAVAVLNLPLTEAFAFATEVTDEGLNAYDLGPTRRAYNGRVSVKSSIPYSPPVIPD
jgi:hypothetical protein